jgi:hypothetical protein
VWCIIPLLVHVGVAQAKVCREIDDLEVLRECNHSLLSDRVGKASEGYVNTRPIYLVHLAHRGQVVGARKGREVWVDITEVPTREGVRSDYPHLHPQPRASGQQDVGWRHGGRSQTAAYLRVRVAC